MNSFHMRRTAPQARQTAPLMLSSVWRIGAAGCRGTGRIMARPCRPSPPWMTLSPAGVSPPRSHSASRRRAPTSAAPTRSTACGGIGRRRSSVGAGRRQAVVQAHARSPVDVRRLYRRRHPVIAKALGVFASVEARARRLSQDAGPRDVELRAARAARRDRSAGPHAMGLPVGRPDSLELLPGGQPQRRGDRVRGERPARGRRAHRPLRARRPRPRRGALGPRRALGRAGGLLRLSRRPSREHPQREHARRLAGRMWAPPPTASPRARRARGAAHARRAAPGRVLGLRRRARPRVGGLVPHGLRAAVPRSPARRRRPRRRRGARGADALPRVLRSRRAARGCGPTSAFPRTAIRRAPV